MYFYTIRMQGIYCFLEVVADPGSFFHIFPVEPSFSLGPGCRHTRRLTSLSLWYNLKKLCSYRLKLLKVKLVWLPWQRSPRSCVIWLRINVWTRGCWAVRQKNVSEFSPTRLDVSLNHNGYELVANVLHNIIQLYISAFMLHWQWR